MSPDIIFEYKRDGLGRPVLEGVLGYKKCRFVFTDHCNTGMLPSEWTMPGLISDCKQIIAEVLR